MRLGPLFRGTFEVQAGNRPLQGQSKPPVFTGGYDYERKGVINLAVKQVTLEILEAIQWGIDEGTLFRYGSVI